MAFLSFPTEERPGFVLRRLQLEINGSQAVVAAGDCLARIPHPDAAVELADAAGESEYILVDGAPRRVAHSLRAGVRGIEDLPRLETRAWFKTGDRILLSEILPQGGFKNGYLDDFHGNFPVFIR